MTSPDPKSTPESAGEGGGMLPALLAGAGILLVAGLLIFGGDDEQKADSAKDPKTATANANAQRASRTGGVGARPVDDATATSTTKPQPKLNPRIANAIVSEGMAPQPKPKPTSFASKAEEIAYWEQELRAAEANLEMRELAAERAPASAEKIRERGTPEEIAQIERRLEVVNDNLEQAKARVAEAEAKLEELRGG